MTRGLALVETVSTRGVAGRARPGAEIRPVVHAGAKAGSDHFSSFREVSVNVCC